MKQFNLDTQTWEDAEPVEPISALAYLQSIYRDPMESESRRLRAAIEAPPFESPKLSAIAVGSMTAQDFAARLEQAVARSGKTIDAKPLALPPPTRTLG